MIEPTEINLTAAAKVLLTDGTDDVAFDLWQALTGVGGYAEAWDQIRAVAHANPPVTAHVPPM